MAENISEWIPLSLSLCTPFSTSERNTKNSHTNKERMLTPSLGIVTRARSPASRLNLKRRGQWYVLFREEKWSQGERERERKKDKNNNSMIFPKRQANRSANDT